MPEAVKAAMAYCFYGAGCDYLTIAHFDFNTQSRRVIEKCGFKFAVSMTVRAALLDGMPEYETLYYKITREEWQHD